MKKDVEDKFRKWMDNRNYDATLQDMLVSYYSGWFDDDPWVEKLFVKTFNLKESCENGKTNKDGE